ncbi:MAG TPA: universal stress protein [Thermoanaerobaculia bacterium]|nr:universal stress protein [Thermoanaerobaculia bacterium]
MFAIKTVLSPVDFSTGTDQEVATAAEVCTTFGARLVLHHNEDTAPLGLSRAWDWDETHVAAQGQRPVAEARMADITRHLSPALAVEAKISRGLVVPSLLFLARQLPADLLVVATRGQTSDDHTSVAERLLVDAPCPVLALRAANGSCCQLELQAAEGALIDVVVPTDLTLPSLTAVDYAFELARQLPLRIHLLHVISGRKASAAEAAETGGDGATRPSAAAEIAQQKLAGLVPEELREQATTHVETGSPGDAILAFAQRLGARFIVMGEHAPDLLRHVFTHDTAKDVLHRASCAVWFVPAV